MRPYDGKQIVSLKRCNMYVYEALKVMYSVEESVIKALQPMGKKSSFPEGETEKNCQALSPNRRTP